MIEIYEIGLTENQLKEMLNINPQLNNIENMEIEEKINLLKKIGCQNIHVAHILFTNPFYLTNNLENTISTINYIESLNLNLLWIIFDSNPMALNLTKIEIENYINSELKKGMNKEEILSNLDETFLSVI